MNFDFTSLNELRANNLAWKILRSDNAPLFLNFIHDAFILRDKAIAPESEVLSVLENILFYKKDLDNAKGIVTLKDAKSYLNDWSHENNKWINKTWPQDSQTIEPFYDIPPSTQKAYDFIKSLDAQKFVGTESKLRIALELLKEIDLGTETDKKKILDNLYEQKRQIEQKIANIKNNKDITLMDEHLLLDRFVQFQKNAMQIVSDFREVDYNLKQLDIEIRKQISTWTGTKGEFIGNFLESTGNIEQSAQGRSVLAFSKFLLNSEVLIQFKYLLQKVLSLDIVQEEKQEGIENIVGNWISGNTLIRNTITRLSHSLRTFIDEDNIKDNRHIYSLIKNLQINVHKINEANLDTKDLCCELTLPKVEFNLPFEKPLYSKEEEVVFDDSNIEADDGEANIQDLESLLQEVAISKEEIRENINTILLEKGNTNLKDIIKQYPLKYGLRELLVYIQVCNSSFDSEVDDSIEDSIVYEIERHNNTYTKKLTMHRVNINFKI